MSVVYTVSPPSDKSKEDYTVWSLYLVFLGVTLPDLAFKPDSTFLPSFEGEGGWDEGRGWDGGRVVGWLVTMIL